MSKNNISKNNNLAKDSGEAYNPSMWYSKNRLLSYNSILNFLIGQRGGGKTYGFKTWCVDDFLKTGRQFVWMRRYNTELRGHGKQMGVLNTWFDDIAHLYPEVDLKIRHGAAYINGEIAGYFGPLSISEQWKSIPFKNVNKVILDEFLIRTGVGQRYLKDEPLIFLELMETVGRLRDDVRYFLIGNALSFSNPYFTYFDIIPFKEGIKHDKERGITIELYNNEEFTEVKRNTKLGSLVADTRYGDYMIENVFLLDDDAFISQRSKDSHPLFNLVWDDHTLGVWYDRENKTIHIDRKHDPTLYAYSFKHKDHGVNMLMIKTQRNNYHFKMLRENFEYGNMRYSDQIVKDVMLHIMPKIL